MHRPGGSNVSRNQTSSSNAVINNQQTITEYRTRLKTAMKSATENIRLLLQAVKISCEETNHKNMPTGRLSQYNTVRNEVGVRSTLIIRAMDDLLTLNNDVKSYMILRDMKTVNEARAQLDRFFIKDVERCKASYETVRELTSNLSTELDKELQDQFQRSY